MKSLETLRGRIKHLQSHGDGQVRGKKEAMREYFLGLDVRLPVAHTGYGTVGTPRGL